MFVFWIIVTLGMKIYMHTVIYSKAKTYLADTERLLPVFPLAEMTK